MFEPYDLRLMADLMEVITPVRTLLYALAHGTKPVGLKALVKEASAQFDEMKLRLAELTVAKLRAENEIDQFKVDADVQTAFIGSLAVKIKDMQLDCDAFEDQLEQAKDELITIRELNAELNKQITELQQELKELSNG